MSERPRFSVVIPSYDEEPNILALADRLKATFAGMGEESWEILWVENGSSDGSLALLEKLHQEDPRCKYLSLSRNFGHSGAVACGLDFADGEFVVLMDGDLQDPPELIPAFYARWQEGADVVYGLRTRRNESRLKRLGTSAFYWLLGKIADTPIPAQVGTFGLIDRRTVDVLNAMPERQRFFAGLRAWVGGKSAFVPYERPDRSCGNSRVGMGGLFRLARTAIFSFSKVPLRFASLFSLSCGLVLFLVGLGAIAIRLLTRMAIPGWATYTTMLGMIGFVQSVVLTILSEYIAIIFDEVKNRPIFLVREEFTQGARVSASSASPTDDRADPGDVATIAAGLDELVDLLRRTQYAEPIPDASSSPRPSPVVSSNDGVE